LFGRNESWRGIKKLSNAHARVWKRAPEVITYATFFKPLDAMDYFWL
jgi:hypothetical protein